VPTDADPESTVQQELNEEAWRQLLVQGVLAVILPTEELENGCLRALVAEIVSEMIIWGALSNKACDGWMLWEAITRVLELLGPKQSESDVETVKSEGGRLEQFGLLASSENVETTTAGETGRTSQGSSALSLSSLSLSSLSAWFWLGVQYVFFALTAARAAILALASSPSLPSRSKTSPTMESEGHPSSNSYLTPRRPRPVLSMSVWPTLGHLMELEVRMPWLSGLFSLLHWLTASGAGRVGGTDGVVDRLVLSSHLPMSLQIAASIF
jgi:PXA domain